MDAATVDGVAASVVREYLSRKGLKQTLSTFDDEQPRGDHSISNRMQLMKALHIEKLMMKNKEVEVPYRTMLEVIVSHFGRKSTPDAETDKKFRRSSQPDSETSELSSSSRQASQSRNESRSERKHSKRLSQSGEDNMMLNRLSESAKSSSGGSKAGTDLVLEDTLDGETTLGAGKSSFLKASSTADDGRNSAVSRPKSKMRGLSGPISSSVEDRRQRGARTPAATLTTTTSNPKPEEIQVTRPSSRFSSGNSLTSASSINKTINGAVTSTTPSRLGGYSSRNQISSPLDKLESDKDSYIEKPSPYTAIDNKYDRLGSDTSLSKSRLEREDFTGKSILDRDDSSEKSWSFATKKKPTTMRVGDLEIGDIDDLEDELGDIDIAPVVPKRPQAQLITNSKPIDIQTAVELKTLIFGNASQKFSDEWKYQGFTFCNRPGLKYGIVQKKGGPCGVLASVQACMLQRLIFGDKERPTTRSLDPSMQQRSDALAKALADIFWRAGNSKRAVVTIPSGRSIFSGSGRYKTDNLTETLVLNHFDVYEELVSFMMQQVAVFEADNNSGVILTLYSAILSRGIKTIIEDMDEPTNKLMGMYGYCTQDMVNLLNCGHAASNVFNNTMELDSGEGPTMILKGVGAQANVGLLSLFEHYKSCEVGSFLKTPRFPIWVVCSESHFSVLFCLKKELLSDWRAERRFDLYYYDGLANQEEEIRLTVDTSSPHYKPPDMDLMPPLEHCIRTKWADAEVDWNGTEPLL